MLRWFAGKKSWSRWLTGALVVAVLLTAAGMAFAIRCRGNDCECDIVDPIEECEYMDKHPVACCMPYWVFWRKWYACDLCERWDSRYRVREHYRTHIDCVNTMNACAQTHDTCP